MNIIKLLLAIGLLLQIFFTSAFAQTELLQELIRQQTGVVSSMPKNINSGDVPQGYVKQSPQSAIVEKASPSDFQQYISKSTGFEIQRFGVDLVKDGDQTYSPPATAPVPNDYILGAGDELFIRVWGSLDLDLRVVVDRSGQILIPKVGVVTVGGLAYEYVTKIVLQAINKNFTAVQVAVSMGQLRGVRVYVTGFAKTPGAYTVNNLSSLVNVLMAAGGPSDAGSFRDIQLKRGNKVIANFDLYDLLIKGDKSQDRAIVAEDVIHVGPAQKQVALVGAFNKPAIYEIKSVDTLNSVIAYAGGFASGSVSDSVNWISFATRNQGFDSINASFYDSKRLQDGDIVLATSAAKIQTSINKQSKFVKVDGEVLKPGMYSLHPEATLQDAINAAGGLSPKAYIYGVQLIRNSIFSSQKLALEKYKTEFKRQVMSAMAVEVSGVADAQAQAAKKSQADMLMKVLDDMKPSGRLSINIDQRDTVLPALILETGDKITIPSMPQTIAVLGSINGSQVTLAYDANLSVEEYIDLAGGYSRGADKSYAYVSRANGTVQRLSSGWLDWSIQRQKISPGDAIFIPEDMNKTTFTKELREWTQIIYQLGLGAAAIKVLK